MRKAGFVFAPSTIWSTFKTCKMQPLVWNISSIFYICTAGKIGSPWTYTLYEGIKAVKRLVEGNEWTISTRSIVPVPHETRMSWRSENQYRIHKRYKLLDSRLQSIISIIRCFRPPLNLSTILFCCFSIYEVFMMKRRRNKTTAIFITCLPPAKGQCIFVCVFLLF